MDKKELNKVITRRVKHIHESLERKGDEYELWEDRLQNFKLAAKMLESTPAEALRGMMVKHLVCIFNEVHMQRKPSREFIDEKVGDAINYLILLDALWSEDKA